MKKYNEESCREYFYTLSKHKIIELYLQKCYDCDLEKSQYKKKIKELKEYINNLEQQCSICNKYNENENLKKQLAEKEKDRLMWQEMYKSADRLNKSICETDIYPLQEENTELKQQLAEKEEQVKQLKLDLKMFKSVNEFINRYGIEKAREVLLQTEKNKNQDKISFAVEQLVKVKMFVARQLMITTKGCSDLDKAEAKGCNELREEIIRELDNLINELKEKENEK